MVVLVIAVSLYYIFGKSGGMQEQALQKGKKPVKVDAVVVSPSELINEINISGSLLAFDEVQLVNEVSGRVVMVNLPEGQFVKAGTLLVKLYDADLQANLKKLQIQLESEEKIFERQKELMQINGISQNEYELAALKLNALKADIEVLKVQIRKTEVLAPFDGVLGLKNVSVGAMVTPSVLLATLRTEDKLKLDFSVPEKYSALVKQGMKVSFSLANTDEIYEANVLAIENGIDINTRNMKARALVTSRSANLIPGAYVNVLLRLSENKNAILVPTQALIPRGEKEFVAIAKNGTSHLVTVKKGIRKKSVIEITEGLQFGDTVLTSGILFLKEGTKIEFSNIKTGAL